MTRIALLANPESGSGEAEAVERELEGLGAELAARLAIDEAERALESGAERIVVAGGDGSIGRAAEIAMRAGVPLAIVPVGTANDFARAQDLRDDLSAACRLAVIGSGTRRHEIGRVDDRPFVNVAAIGLSPAAARRAKGLKRALGPLAYAVGALRAGLGADPVRCRVTAGDGGELYAGEAWQATIACSGAFGGGAQLEADPTDGLLDAVVVEASSRLTLVRRAHGMRRGTLEEQPGVHRRRAPAFDIELERDTDLNVDGELITRSGTVRFTVDPVGVEIVVG